MAMDPKNVRAWLAGEVWVAPAGTAMPSDLSSGLPSDWSSLGVLDEEAGAEEAPSENITEHYGWGVGIVRVTYNQFKITLKVIALETNPVVENLLNPEHDASGNGSVTTYSRKAPTHKPVALVLETTDGDIFERRCAKSADASQTAPLVMGQTGIAKREITFNLYPDSDGSFFTTITDDPAMKALASL